MSLKQSKLFVARTKFSDKRHNTIIKIEFGGGRY